MEKTSVYFNKNGLANENSTVNEIISTNSDKETLSIEEGFTGKERCIDFETVPEIKPAELTIEERLENLEKKQDQIIQMLQQLCNQHPKYKGYITLDEAVKRYEATERKIYQQISWFQRVRHIKIDKKELNGKRYYREEDLVQALFIDIKLESERRFQSKFSKVKNL
jgi:hypothetical protein